MKKIVCCLLTIAVLMGTISATADTVSDMINADKNLMAISGRALTGLIKTYENGEGQNLKTFCMIYSYYQLYIASLYNANVLSALVAGLGDESLKTSALANAFLDSAMNEKYQNCLNGTEDKMEFVKLLKSMYEASESGGN